MKVKVSGIRKAFVGRVKVYGKGTINLPKEALELLKVNKGDDILLIAKEGRMELRKPRSLDELAGSLKKLNVSEEELKTLQELAYAGLRGAFADAYEFFEDIKEGVPYGERFSLGELYGKVYLQLERGDLRKSIHLSYFELPKYPRGIITVDGGIKEFLESEEDKKYVEENKEKIMKALEGLVTLQEFGENGFILIVSPEFNRKEAAFISVVIAMVSSILNTGS